VAAECDILTTVVGRTSWQYLRRSTFDQQPCPVNHTEHLTICAARRVKQRVARVHLRQRTLCAITLMVYNIVLSIWNCAVCDSRVSYWNCPHNMRNKVYVTVGHPFIYVCLFQHSAAARRCCWPGVHNISIDCCLAGGQQQSRRSTMLSSKWKCGLSRCQLT